MEAPELSTQICAAMGEWARSCDELGALDQALGDGDLGVTVSMGASAVAAALSDLDDQASLTAVIVAAAKAFANANPSTMAALVASGLLAGSRGWADKHDVGLADAATFVKTAGEAISARGRTRLGDKTMVDAIMPAAAALAAAHDSAAEALDAAIVAAEDAVRATTDMQSQRGRAAWLQERSIGTPDPGATAFLRLLEAWRTTFRKAGPR